MRKALFLMVSALLCSTAVTDESSERSLQVEIQSPSPNFVVEDGATIRFAQV